MSGRGKFLWKKSGHSASGARTNSSFLSLNPPPETYSRVNVIQNRSRCLGRTHALFDKLTGLLWLHSAFLELLDGRSPSGDALIFVLRDFDPFPETSAARRYQAYPYS